MKIIAYNILFLSNFYPDYFGTLRCHKLGAMILFVSGFFME